MPSTTDSTSRKTPPGFYVRILPSPSGRGLGWGRFPSWCSLWLIVLAIACGGSGGVIVPPTEEFGGPEYAAVVVTSDLALGENRIAFGVVSRDEGPLQADSATVRTYFLPPNTETRESRETLTARFETWPFSGGVFTAYPQFDVVGSWELEAEFTTPDGQEVFAKSAFPVKDVSDTPSVGDPAPASVTSVASDFRDISHITTATEPDPALYAISIRDAIAEGKPLVVGFSTPRYCTTATCGPQLEQLSSLQQTHGDRANIIHVEVYKDPHLFEEEGRRPGRADIVDAVEEWGLPTEPWTFIVDAEGIVRAKFEAYTPAPVIEEALLKVLN